MIPSTNGCNDQSQAQARAWCFFQVSFVAVAAILGVNQQAENLSPSSLSVCLSNNLSYIYEHIYMYVCMCVYIYIIYIDIFLIPVKLEY